MYTRDIKVYVRKNGGDILINKFFLFEKGDKFFVGMVELHKMV